jgi:hypothetical protein
MAVIQEFRNDKSVPLDSSNYNFTFFVKKII